MTKWKKIISTSFFGCYNEEKHVLKKMFSWFMGMLWNIFLVVLVWSVRVGEVKSSDMCTYRCGQLYMLTWFVIFVAPSASSSVKKFKANAVRLMWHLIQYNLKRMQWKYIMWLGCNDTCHSEANNSEITWQYQIKQALSSDQCKMHWNSQGSIPNRRVCRGDDLQ